MASVMNKKNIQVDFPEINKLTISKKEQKLIVEQNISSQAENSAETTSNSSETRKIYRTQACRNVAKEGAEKGVFGVCWKESCTYAHSIEEFEVVPCSYGDDCYHLCEGSQKICFFRHPFEKDIEEWFKRTRTYRPDLPLKTTTKTRNPTLSKPSSATKLLPATKPNSIGLKVSLATPKTSSNPWQKSQDSAETKNKTTQELNSTSDSETEEPKVETKKVKPSKWDEKPKTSQKRPSKPRRKKYSSDESSDSSSDSDDTYEKFLKRREKPRKQRESPTLDSEDSPTLFVIPNKECFVVLAQEMAKTGKHYLVKFPHQLIKEDPKLDITWVPDLDCAKIFIKALVNSDRKEPVHIEIL